MITPRDLFGDLDDDYHLWFEYLQPWRDAMKRQMTERSFARLATVGGLIATAAIALAVGPPTPVQAASIVVTTEADIAADDGFCSLREAIDNADDDAATHADCPAGVGADVITFNVPGVPEPTIVLSSNLPAINGFSFDPGLADMSIVGPATIDGAGMYRPITISMTPSETIRLSELTIQNGFDSGSQVAGGGIFSIGATLIIERSSIIDNLAQWETATQVTAEGGGIYIGSGQLDLTDSTVARNTAEATTDGDTASAFGGGIAGQANLNIINSTVTGNRAIATIGSTVSDNRAAGAGVYSPFGPVVVSNSTITDNTLESTVDGGYAAGVFVAFDYDPTMLTVESSLLANVGGNCQVLFDDYNGDPDIVADGSSVATDDTCDAATIDATLADSLDPLGDYGGPTETIRPQSTSSAIDAGSNPRNLTTDQRGAARIAGVAIDAGSFERSVEPVSVVLEQAGGQSDPASALPIEFAVIFSEAVTGFDAADVTIDGTAAPVVTVTDTGDSASFMVSVDGVASGDTITATIPADAVTGQQSGNPNLASISDDNQVTYSPPIESTTTTSTTTSTTVPASSTTVPAASTSSTTLPAGVTSTTLDISPPAPTTSPQTTAPVTVAPMLPATGQGTNGAALAALLLGSGLALWTLTRRRPA